MKHFKKLSLTTVAALLLLLAVTGGTSPTLPSVPVDKENILPTPQPEEPSFQPLADEDDDEIDIEKTF